MVNFVTADLVCFSLVHCFILEVVLQRIVCRLVYLEGLDTVFYVHVKYYLIVGFFQVRCWEVEQTGKTIPKSMQTMQGPVLDVCWSDVSDSVIKIR
jgi:hypothetical protein